MRLPLRQYFSLQPLPIFWALLIAAWMVFIIVPLFLPVLRTGEFSHADPEPLRPIFFLLFFASSIVAAIEALVRLGSRQLHHWEAISIMAISTSAPLFLGLLLDSSFLVQFGALGFTGALVCGAILRVHREQPRHAIRSIRRFSLSTVAIVSIAFLTGEIALRLFYPTGVSFGTKGGPLVARFERDFVFNRFDGPSRGPDIAIGDNTGSPRILIQGDSIAWGQGVRDESDLFSYRLLAALRANFPNIAIAVLSKPGREIDGHIAQLSKWGSEICPDLIIYQWFVNDVEISDLPRPVPRGRFWRSFTLHPVLMSHSYFWFILDFSLNRVLPAPSPTYDDFMMENFAPGTPGWTHFINAFDSWLAEANALTDNVIVALYPRVSKDMQPALRDISNALMSHSQEKGVVAVDLWDAVKPLSDDPHTLFASPFDGHPSAQAHKRIAAMLTKHVERILSRAGSYANGSTVPSCTDIAGTNKDQS